MFITIRKVQSGNSSSAETSSRVLFENFKKQVEEYKLQLNSIVQFNIFVTNQYDFREVRESLIDELKKVYNGNIPATSIVAQTPLDGSSLNLEYIILDDSGDYSVEYKEVSTGIYYTVISGNQFKMVVGAGLTNAVSDECREQVETSFAYMDNILRNEEMNFSHVIRQWNYLEEITCTFNDNGEVRQNYQVLNDIRSQYYSTAQFNNGYPAATGIGMQAGGFILEFVAVKGDGNLQVLPLHNPLQTDAYQYSQKKLIGDSLLKTKKKAAPLFERAKIMVHNNEPIIYISGTAAIHEEESLARDDVKEQTNITICNIDKLYSLIPKQNLNGAEAGNYKIIYARVYIKDEESYEEVKVQCDEYFKGALVQYLVSDVCREELLVEIEAIICPE